MVYKTMYTMVYKTMYSEWRYIKLCIYYGIRNHVEWLMVYKAMHMMMYKIMYLGWIMMYETIHNKWWYTNHSQLVMLVMVCETIHTEQWCGAFDNTQGISQRCTVCIWDDCLQAWYTRTGEEQTLLCWTTVLPENCACRVCNGRDGRLVDQRK